MDKQIVSLKDWLNYDVETIRKGVETSRFLFLFNRDFKEITGDIPCTNCKSFAKKLDSFKKKIEKMSDQKVKCDFEIKAMYNSLLGYFNATLTNKKAHELAAKHPRGYGLFSRVSDEVQSKLDKEKEKEDLEKAKSIEDAEKLAEKLAKEEADKMEERRKYALKKEEEELLKQRKNRLESKSIEWLRSKAKTTEGTKNELIEKILKKEK
jgi:lipopolysaccharide export LptBFGC system permease protein LptF